MSEPDDLSQQYQEVLELEQECWNFSEWCHPEQNSVTPLSSAGSAGDSDSSEDDEAEELNGVEGSESPVISTSTPYNNEYVRTLLDSADLCIMQPGLVNAAYESENKELGLFHLFLTQNYLETVCKWTNEVLERKGRKQATVKEFYAYIGLEMGMSLLRYNDIKKYWAEGSFVGHETFRDTMSRNRFQEIRSCISFLSPKAYDAATAHDDPLWTCRSLLDHFIRRSADIAVPLGISALDENSCATKARTRAKTYSPNKPDKYAIRFYAVVGHKHCYLSSMFDNRAGNNTGVEGVHDYCRLFRTLRTPYYRVIGSDATKDSLADTPSSLWVCMMGHQTANKKQPNGGKRYFFSDNYYTRHTLASKLSQFTDGESFLIGTVKFPNIDATNRYYVSQAVEKLKNASRGEWMLVQAFNKHPDYDRLHDAHRRQSNQAPFIPPLELRSEKAGYIVFKDSKVVIFYTNDLFEMPPEPLLQCTDERAVKCVHGLAKISRWTGIEMLHRTDFFVPAPIVAYNMFMNGVDRMDQRRATLATQRKEQRIQMTLFTFILDLAVKQGFAIYQKLVMGRAEKKLTFFNFKRNLCDSLIMPLRSSRPVGRPRKRSKPNSPREGTTERTTIEEAVGTIDNTHMLVENLGRKNVSKKPINEKPKDIDCYLCRKMGLELKTIYSCIKCRKGFHVNCFTAFHF
jgi:hypothetical protein